jgi:hypothetical protein
MYLYSLQIKGDSNKKIQFVPHRNHITSPLQNKSKIQFVPHRNHITLPLQNKSDIQFVPHRNHITSPLQNESEIQFVPHRNHITSPLQNERGLKPIYMEVCFIPLVILHHLLNVSIQLANKRGFTKKKRLCKGQLDNLCCSFVLA